MGRIALKCLVAIVTTLSNAGNAAADREIDFPIRYAVEDNNRLFFGGDSDRYVMDLHQYLKCASRAGRGAKECAEYRRTAFRGSAEVPDLRTDPLRKYSVRYDDESLSHPTDYATSGKRRVRFWLSNVWQRQNSRAVYGCRWAIEALGRKVEYHSEDCGPITHEIELAPSADGSQMLWRAAIRLSLNLSGGGTLSIDSTALVRDYLIVAMGDSFTSGEGNPERNATQTGPAQWLDDRCNRSVFSYPVMVATQLALLDPRHSVTLIHVACSGAKAKEGILESYAGVIGKWRSVILHRRQLFERQRIVRLARMKALLPPQLLQVEGLLSVPGSDWRRKPDLLMMSVGVNDVGFSALLKRLATQKCDEDCFADLRKLRNSRPGDCPSSRPLEISFECLEERLVAVHRAIERKLAPKHTYLMHYFNPVRDSNNKLCGEETFGGKRKLLGGIPKPVQWVAGIQLTREEFAFAETDFYIPLLQVLSRVADRAGWVVPAPLQIHEVTKKNNKGRGFCGSPSWYHTYEDAKARQGTTPLSLIESTGTLHPTGFGHFYAALRVLTQLHKDRSLIDHNIGALTEAEFDPVAYGSDRPNKEVGFAHFIHNMAKDRIETYFKF